MTIEQLFVPHYEQSFVQHLFDSHRLVTPLVKDAHHVPHTHAHYTVVLPQPCRTYAVHVVGPGQLAEPSAQHQVITCVGALLVSLVLVAVSSPSWLGAGSVLANRGGAPASASAVRPATSYVVQPGDTLWSIAAAATTATASQVDYVDALVSANGGAVLQVGQVITLPVTPRRVA